MIALKTLAVMLRSPWERRIATADLRTCAAVARSTVLSIAEEASSSRYAPAGTAWGVLLPPDNCLYALAGHDPAFHPLVIAPPSPAARHFAVGEDQG
jgi:hypothetical protein